MHVNKLAFWMLPSSCTEHHVTRLQPIVAAVPKQQPNCCA